MLLIREKFRAKESTTGFALIEVITVIAILGIISAVLVPSFVGIIRGAERKICGINCLKVEEMYEVYLFEHGKEYSDIMFNIYIQEEGKDICPGSGVISFEDGKIRCSVHPLGQDDGGEELPYL